MKHLQLFESFKKSTDLKSILSTIKDHLKDDYFTVKPKMDKEKITLSEGDYKMEVYDNGQKNDFFLVRVSEKNKVIQDFKKNKPEDGYSPDEIPTENILMMISRYFQNN